MRSYALVSRSTILKPVQRMGHAGRAAPRIRLKPLSDQCEVVHRGCGRRQACQPVGVRFCCRLRARSTTIIVPVCTVSCPTTVDRLATSISARARSGSDRCARIPARRKGLRLGIIITVLIVATRGRCSGAGQSFRPFGKACSISARLGRGSRLQLGQHLLSLGWNC